MSVISGVRRLVHEHPVLSAFFSVYYVALVAYGVATGAGQTIFYGVFVLIAAAAVASLYARTPLSTIVLWGLGLWGLGHMVGGIIEVGGVTIYEQPTDTGEFRFDKVVHFFGFGFATLAAYELLRKERTFAVSARFAAVTAAFVGLGIGAVNETIEFLITRLPLESNVGGFSNTGWDLVANATGAATASVAAHLISTERRDNRRAESPPTRAFP